MDGMKDKKLETQPMSFRPDPVIRDLIEKDVRDLNHMGMTSARWLHRICLSFYRDRLPERLLAILNKGFGGTGKEEP